MNGKQYIQCSENIHSSQYGSQYSILQGTLSPTGTFGDIYTPLGSQNMQKNSSRHQENPYIFPEVANWENLKLPEKIDFLEISNKDLSPGSYCSNIDNLLALESNFNSPYNNRYENQWYNCNNINYGQKSNEYPSCAQVNKYSSDSSKPGMFYNGQKSNTDMEMYKSCAYYNSDVAYAPSNELKNKNLLQGTYNSYNSYYGPVENNYYMQNSQTLCQSSLSHNPLDIINMDRAKPTYNCGYAVNSDQQTEASNEESDIVVEDSSSDCSEDQEKSLAYDNKKCLLCNRMYTPLGLQFYYLTSENPLTMSSQIPVIQKIMNLVHCDIVPMNHFLCNNCLELINAIDNLQLKLQQYYRDLKRKFNKSCVEHGLSNKTIPVNKKKRIPRFKCKICKKVIWVTTILNNHIKKHRARTYLCELCGKITLSFKKLKHHLKFHKKKKVKTLTPFVCSNMHCDKSFRTKSNLKEHENYCLGTLPYKCKNNYCDKKFASATKLKNHTKLKHDKKFIAICSICNIGFVKLSDYKSHKITHSTVKKFSCTKCGKSYKTASNLNFHLKSHDKKLPFICPLCQRGFMRKEYLEAHVNNHKGVKNFSCSICDKKFVSQKNLDAHFKYHEGNVKTNTCNICGKVITSGFEEHLRVHLNLKEFECDNCDRRFNTKNTLAKHKKIKHTNVER